MNRKDINIFIVDDDVSVHRSLKRLVNSTGYRAMTFRSAREFIDSGQHLRSGILVLDVRMPGMNGLELQKFLADEGIDLPIIFISAHDDSIVRQQALEAGAVAFHFKPFGGQTLLDSINKAFSR